MDRIQIELIVALEAAEAARKSAEIAEQEAKRILDELMIELAAEKAKENNPGDKIAERVVKDFDKTGDNETSQSSSEIVEPLSLS